MLHQAVFGISESKTDRRLSHCQRKVPGDSIHAPFFERLLNPDFFSAVKLDSYGTLCWNDEIDFCPDVLYVNSHPV
jgi:hypothetical protein